MPDASKKNNKNSRATYELTQRVFSSSSTFFKTKYPLQFVIYK
mgnify:CR=1 FL=1